MEINRVFIFFGFVASIVFSACEPNENMPQYQHNQYKLNVYLPEELNLTLDSCAYLFKNSTKVCHCTYHSDSFETLTISHRYDSKCAFYIDKYLAEMVYNKRTCITEDYYTVFRKEVNFEPLHEYICDEMCSSYKVDGGYNEINMYRRYQTSDSSDLVVTYSNFVQRKDYDLLSTLARMALVDQIRNIE